MRSKSRNVQHPLRRSPRKPDSTSSKALPVLINQDHTPTKTVFETSSDSDVIEKEKESNLSPKMANNREEHMNSDSLGLGNCIRCDNGDDLVLFCGGKGCSIAVHEKCMGCDPKFDESGKFRCPFCEQKLAAALVVESRRKVMEAKKALSSFLEGNTVIVGGRNKEEKVVENVGKENQITGLDIKKKKKKKKKKRTTGSEELGCSDRAKTVLENVIRPNSSVVNGNDNVGPVKSVRFKEKGRVEAVEEEQTEVAKESEEQIQPEEVSDEIENDNSVSETEASVKRPKRFKRRAGKEENLPEDTGVQEPFLRRKAVAKKYASNFYEKTSTRSKSRAANTISIANFPREKRKRLHWTADEEEMLTKCVEKYSEGAINIPWRKILDDGGAIFHKTRVPGDLKEKWRNMTRSKRQ